MKKLIAFIFIFIHSFAYADYWTQKANYITYLAGISGFAIGNAGYCGTGIFGVGGVLITNFRTYNPGTNFWSSKAVFSGVARFRGTGSSIDSLGYIGLGIGANNDLQDWWQYNPALNTWTQKADFGGGPIRDAAGFVIGSFGFIATGGINYSNQLWQYDPASNSWLQLTSFPGAGRQLAVGFSIDGKGYIGTGYNGSALNDFWEYDPVTDNWSQKAGFPGLSRFAASGFAIGNKGYIGLGSNNSNALKDFWEYDPLTNLWNQKTDFGGDARSYAAHFSIGSKGYIGTGLGNGSTLLNDFWEYTPDSPLETNQAEVSSEEFAVYPNPASDELFVNGLASGEIGKEKIEITITDINGKTVETLNIATLQNNIKINISNFPNGIYFVTVETENKKLVKKFIKN